MQTLDLAKRTTAIIWNKETDNIMNIIKCLEESGLLAEGVSETIKNKTKKQTGGFLSMLFGT